MDEKEPNHVKAWRLHRGLTQAELAEKCDTSQNQIAYLERGERNLSPKWLRRLADALDTTPGHLLDHNPKDMDSDILDIWAHISKRDRPRALDVLRAFRTGTDD